MISRYINDAEIEVYYSTFTENNNYSLLKTSVF